jgi:hypothetical protein
MIYIISSIIEVPANNHRFVSLGFEPGKSYSIQSIRWNREAKKIEYRLNTQSKECLSFDSTAEADAFFDRIRGVVRQIPTTPLDDDTAI